MEIIRLGCSGCSEYLSVEVTDAYGAWTSADEASLMKAADAAGWKARILDADMAYVYCPVHRDEAPVAG